VGRQYRSAYCARSSTSSGRRRITLGAGKACDVATFVEALRRRAMAPHVAIDGNVGKSDKPRSTAIDQRTGLHPGYAISQVIRKRIKEIFGWGETIGRLAQVGLRGRDRFTARFTFRVSAYNLVPLPMLPAEQLRSSACPRGANSVHRTSPSTSKSSTSPDRCAMATKSVDWAFQQPATIAEFLGPGRWIRCSYRYSVPSSLPIQVEASSGRGIRPRACPDALHMVRVSGNGP